MHQMNVDDIVASDYPNIDNRIEVADIINEEDIIATQKVPKKEDGKAKGGRMQHSIKYVCFE